jgi:hypothetical protein
MKKILAVMLLLVAFVAVGYGANETYVGVATGGVKIAPSNVKGYSLNTRNTASSIDTFATTTRKTYGPYPVVTSDNKGMASAFTVFADIITGTTPVAAFDYQLLPGKSASDAVDNWTPVCTLGTAGVISTVDLTGKIGESIMFRVNNYDNSTTEIPGLLKVYIKE